MIQEVSGIVYFYHFYSILKSSTCLHKQGRTIFTRIGTITYANKENPDQAPCCVLSDLGLHCLCISFLWAASY